MKLAFIPPNVVNGRLVVKYKEIDVLPGVNCWKSAAFGYIVIICFKMVHVFFARRPLIIKAWTHDAKIDRKGEARVPVWPLMVDSATSTLKRIACVRVYVEIDVNWELSEFVPLIDDLGNEFQQKNQF
ncbi:hypothetical protein LIER_08963 [Lithospermum erythrorhizon]|uniref:Uncharacterized protein n=1 Tax=Lithospermum erythrorhizon TaxID=34254 RepID=A0AAV3PFY8_LITER